MAKVIELEEYSYRCGDGCCDDWGWDYKLIENGEVILSGSEYTQERALTAVLEHLGISVIEKFEF